MGRDSGEMHPRTAYPPGYLFNDEGVQVCGYWMARRLRVCPVTILYPNGRCYGHGGRAQTGAANGQHSNGDSAARLRRHGRYDPYLPERLLERFEAAETDPDILSVRGEMALMTVRIQDVIDRLDQGESGELWSRLREMTAQYRAEQDLSVKAQILADIFQAIYRGAEEYLGWQEVQRLAESRRRLSETEQKRMVQLRQYMTAEQAMYLTSSLADIVVRNVTDPVALDRIRREFAGILTSTHPAALRAESIDGATVPS